MGNSEIQGNLTAVPDDWLRGQNYRGSGRNPEQWHVCFILASFCFSPLAKIGECLKKRVFHTATVVILGEISLPESYNEQLTSHFNSIFHFESYDMSQACLHSVMFLVMAANVVGHNSERGPHKDHSTKVWSRLAKQFQRRRFV